MLWQPLSDMTTRALSLRSSPAKLAEILEIGADFCAVTMDEALDLAFQDIAPCPVTDPAPRPKRRLPRLVVQRSAAISGP